MSDRPRLHIQQSQLQYSGRLREPFLRLGLETLEIAENLLRSLEPFGAQLDSLAMTPSTPRPAETSVSLSFLGGYATAALSPLGIEVSFLGPGDGHPNLPFLLPPPEFSQILVALGKVVGASSGQHGFKEHAFRLDLHAELQGRTTTELLGTLVKAPPAVLGDPQEVGVRYVFGPVGSRLGSWLVVEPSTRVRPGLFVSASVTLDGEEVETENAAEQARAYLKSIVASPDFPVEVSRE
jgi:hypothetical protein